MVLRAYAIRPIRKKCFHGIGQSPPLPIDYPLLLNLSIILAHRRLSVHALPTCSSGGIPRPVNPGYVCAVPTSISVGYPTRRGSLLIRPYVGGVTTGF